MKLFVLCILPARGLFSFTLPSQRQSLRRPRNNGWLHSVNGDSTNGWHHSANGDSTVGSSVDRRAALRALAALAALGPVAGAEGAYFADDVGSWTRLPSATEMRQDFVKLEKVYSLRFFEYLARLLLNHDPTSATWWEKKVKELPPRGGTARASWVPIDLGALVPVLGEDGVVRPRGRSEYSAEADKAKARPSEGPLEDKVKTVEHIAKDTPNCLRGWCLCLKLVRAHPHISL